MTFKKISVVISVARPRWVRLKAEHERKLDMCAQRKHIVVCTAPTGSDVGKVVFRVIKYGYIGVSATGLSPSPTFQGFVAHSFVSTGRENRGDVFYGTFGVSGGRGRPTLLVEGGVGSVLDKWQSI